VWTILYDIIIYPIEFLVELMYVFFMKALGVEGLAIIGISVAVNLLTLPLYHAAEQLQKVERDQRIALAPGIARIKAAFKGDERYMILSTFYRQNHYHPMYALRNSLSLLIQVPFFIAAYHFLSHLDALNGVSFLFIHDLGSPDGLLSVQGRSINVFPLLMTVINLLSGAIYSRSFPVRDKLQIYGLSLVFLILLYSSPAGLVFYWTMNNIFSLGKNVLARIKHPLKVFYGMAAVASISGAAFVIFTNPSITRVKMAFVVMLALTIVCIPLVLRLVRYFYDRFLSSLEDSGELSLRLFVLSCLILWLVAGVLIPSNLIATSVQEFAMVTQGAHPLLLTFHTAVIFAGIFLFWPIVLFILSEQKLRAGASPIFFFLAVTALMNVFLFKNSYGVIDPLLVFENPGMLRASYVISLLSVIVFVVLLAVIMLVVARKKLGNLIPLGMVILVAGFSVSGFNMWQIDREYRSYQAILSSKESQESGGHQDITPVIHLSRQGRNVVVLMLDRAISSYFPLIIEQFPQLKEQFSGFAYYPNTVSFGSGTLTGAPSLMGGYEYTPRAINARSEESLVDKHNESILVLPRIFDEAGFSVLVTDPPFSNYSWTGDFTPFEEYPTVDVRHQHGMYSLRYKQDHQKDFNEQEDARVLLEQRLPMFTLMMASFPFAREEMYDSGNYLSALGVSSNFDEFLASYAQLYYLREITGYDATGDTYSFIDNETTHQPMNLQFPDLCPTSFLEKVYNPFEGIEGINERDIGTYHVNAASLTRIGLWLEELKREGIYDTTRIIIVADHGRDVYIPQFAEYEKNSRIYGDYNPLLLFKDFSQEGALRTDRSFMTNADTPVLALKGLGIDPLNPFTGKDLFAQVDKEVVEVFKGPWAPPKGGTQFDFNDARSFRVREDVFKESNWESLEGDL